MATIGALNNLQVSRETEAGFFLDADNLGEVFISKRLTPEGLAVNDSLDALIYVDSDDRLVATTEMPLALVGEFAWLKVVSVTNVGAFLDWGLPKDLLLPFAEQKYKPEEGRRVMVRIYQDNSNRLAASTRLNDFLEDEAEGFKAGQKVDLLIADTTELGYKTIVNNSHWGVLYSNETSQSLSKGQRLSGYIKRIRADKRIDLSLLPPAHLQVDPVAELIVSTLKQHDGYMLLTDKSSPESIYSLFKVSKKVYKRAIGALYKQRRIDIEQQGIRLLGSAE